MDKSLLSLSLFLLSVIVAFILLYTAYLINRRKNLSVAIDTAIDESMFSPTRFVIYDKSSETKCDRLITILPFEWYVWACRNELYILNPEGGYHCAENSIPVVQVIGKSFKMSCIELNLDTLLQDYMKNGVRKVVDYTINGRKFTILSALNILVKDWITFHVQTDGSSNEDFKEIATDPVTQVQLNEIHAESLYVNRQDSQKQIVGDGRSLTSHEVLKLMTTPKHKSHTELLDLYTQHVSSPVQPTKLRSRRNRRIRR